MYYKQRHILVNLAVLVFSLFFLATAAFAQGGEQANSPGTSGQKPLSFLSITLVDSGENVQNANDIPASEPKFKLQFDKNVVNNTIWEINRKCFSLVSQDNQSIPVNVTKVDDTIDFTQRQVIFIQPAATLSPGTAYTLQVSPDLKAKNGVSTLGGTSGGKGVSFSFKTQGQAIAQSVTQPVTQSVTQPITEPVNQPTPSGGQDTGQTTNENMQIQTNEGNNSDTSNADNAGNATITESAGNPDNKTPEVTAGQQQVATSAGQASESLQQRDPESPVNAGMNLNYTNLLTILAVALIIGWIAVEVFIKRKKKGF